MGEDVIKPPSAASDPSGRRSGGPLVEVAGRVKWFDAAKGYGFIVPDGGEADVLIHVTVLRRDGFSALREGSRVVAEAQRRDRGLQVLKVISVVEPDSAMRRRARPDPRPGGAGRRIRDRHRQVVQPDPGFGFLTRGEGTEDIFVHMETLRRYGFVDPKPGDSMLARFGPGPKGLMAAEVRPLDGSRSLAPN